MGKIVDMSFKDGNGVDQIVVNEYLANPKFVAFLSDELRFKEFQHGWHIKSVDCGVLRDNGVGYRE